MSSGLSLCIQGTYFYDNNQKEIERFIPVHTGNMIGFINLHSGHSVYPCAYREHLLCLALVLDVAGLSLCIQGTY